MEEIGDVCKTRGEITIEWRIKEFSQLNQEIDKRYASPKFYFSGASWAIRLHPNGETQYKSNGWLSLYVIRQSSGSPVTLEFSFRFKSIDGKNDSLVTSTRDFNKKEDGWGSNKIILKSALMERKSEFLPSDILTVVCTLKNKERNDVARKSSIKHFQVYVKTA